MGTITFDSIQKNLQNSQRDTQYVGASFEKSNVESIFYSILCTDNATPHCITLMTEKVVCF